MAEDRGIRRFIRLILDRESAKQVESQMTDTLAKAGDQGGKAFLRELRQEFDQRMAELRVRLAKGLISPEEFRREADQAARAFNTKLAGAIERLRKEGNLTDKEFAKLGRRFKMVGVEGTSAFGKIRTSLGSLTGLLGGGFALYRVFDVIRDSNRAANELDASVRKLGATARITGTDLAFLETTAARVKTEFRLTTQLSNDLTIELTKLATKAGDVAQAGPGIEAFLNIGAARGLDAEATLNAVRQAILGIDEGTDKLFNKNPSVIYAEFAKQIGTTAGKLTDTQKAQALLNAAFEDGSKVRGEYAEWLRSAAGQQFQLRVRIEETKAAFGRALQPALLAILPVLTKAAEWTGKFIQGIQAFGAILPVGAAHVEVWAKQVLATVTGLFTGVVRKVGEFWQALTSVPGFIRAMFGMEDAGAQGTNALVAWADRVDKAMAGMVQNALNQLEFLRRGAREVLGEIFGQAPSGGAAPTGGGGGGGGGEGGGSAQAIGNVAHRDIGSQIVAGLSDAGDEVMVFEALVQGSLGRIREDAAITSDTLGGIGQALAEGGLAGLARFASGKVKENLAEAIEETARAFGALATGNAPAATLHFKAAGEHGIAAAAWGGLSGAGGGGGGGGVPSGASDFGGATASRVESPPTEVNIFIDPISAANPAFVEVVQGARIIGQELWGEQKPIVNVLPRSAGR